MANITWYVKNEDSEYESTDLKYAGSYTGDEPLSLSLQVWNNRYGVKPEKDISPLKINLSFPTEEDAALLKYCILSTEDAEGEKTISGRTATFVFPRSTSLSGKVNNGIEKNNPENFVNLYLTFDPPKNTVLKMNDLKEMILCVVE